MENKLTKVLEDNFYVCEKDDEAVKELYEENEMLDDFSALVGKYCRDDGLVVLPAGTLLEQVEACNEQGAPEIWKIVADGIELLIWDWD